MPGPKKEATAMSIKKLWRTILEMDSCIVLDLHMISAKYNIGVIAFGRWPASIGDIVNKPVIASLVLYRYSPIVRHALVTGESCSYRRYRRARSGDFWYSSVPHTNGSLLPLGLAGASETRRQIV
jgi:hypothetical protein